jgi:hypothetical protein
MRRRAGRAEREFFEGVTAMSIRVMRRLALSAMLGMCLILLSIPVEAVPAHGTPGATSLVQGTSADGSVFTGTFTPTSFSVVNGTLIATGTLAGTILNSSGTSIGTVSQTVQMLVSSIDPTCQILTLTLGPLHINLLGLVIDLNQVVLTITAVPGNWQLTRKPPLCVGKLAEWWHSIPAVPNCCLAESNFGGFAGTLTNKPPLGTVADPIFLSKSLARSDPKPENYDSGKLSNCLASELALPAHRPRGFPARPLTSIAASENNGLEEIPFREPSG